MVIILVSWSYLTLAEPRARPPFRRAPQTTIAASRGSESSSGRIPRNLE
jgi:hypothetical protein